MIKTVELFAGSRSFSRVAAMYGCDTFTVDWQPFEGIDLVADVGALDLRAELPYIPDVIWASPDCTTYSRAAGRLHRIKGIPITEYAEKCDEINTFFLGQLETLVSENPGMLYFIENPVGQFGKMPFLKNFLSRTGGHETRVCYCQYGHPYMKPTSIFTNSQTWQPRPMCYNNNPNCHHERARRSSGGGIRSLNSKYERSIMPRLLMFEIVESFLAQFPEK